MKGHIRLLVAIDYPFADLSKEQREQFKSLMAHAASAWMIANVDPKSVLIKTALYRGESANP